VRIIISGPAVIISGFFVVFSAGEHIGIINVTDPVRLAEDVIGVNAVLNCKRATRVPNRIAFLLPPIIMCKI